MFINFDAHELESLYNSVLANSDIETTKLIDYFAETGIAFIPDDLVGMFRNLCNSIIEINENNFDFIVFNSVETIFVIFTKEIRGLYKDIYKM